MRILATALFDWALALGCGCLLTACWLLETTKTTSRISLGLRLASSLMLVSLCGQIYLLTMSFAGKTQLREVMTSLPAIANTHIGALLSAMMGLSGVLLLVSVMSQKTRAMSGLLIGGVLILHAAMGHAAGDGDFSPLEGLQFVHLVAMAVWTGGVVVAGIFVLPQLHDAPGHVKKLYLRRLSWTSTWAVALVAVTGTVKGYNGVEGHWRSMIGTSWGEILLLKISLVCVALGLGIGHHRWIHDPQRDWQINHTGQMARTMRLEAICLTLVVLLSAWLANTEPASSFLP